jgi:proteasome accessory factor A
VSAVEHQFMLHEEAAAFVDAGGADGLVPGAADLLRRWGRVLEALRGRDWAFLARNLDWVAKRVLLERAAGRRGLSFSDPGIKTIDHMWSALDGGLYQALVRSGEVDCLVSRERIAQAGREPPPDTRAYARAHLLRAFGRQVRRVDWHELEIEVGGTRWWVSLSDPWRHTRDELGELGSCAPAELLDRLGAVRVPWRAPAAVFPPARHNVAPPIPTIFPLNPEPKRTDER